MSKVKINWFNPTKEYEFIENDAVEEDVLLNVFTLLLFFVVSFILGQ